MFIFFSPLTTLLPAVDCRSFGGSLLSVELDERENKLELAEMIQQEVCLEADGRSPPYLLCALLGVYVIQDMI